MSNTGLIIEERSRDIGDFMVGRLLPFRKKRMVGPFIFIDHMGPSTLGPNHYMEIGQHPHIGISTLTYLFEGEVMHRDSLGTEQRVVPGSVGWMTAGKGIVHTERTPEDLKGRTFNTHGFQIWVALPKSKEEMNPEFSFTMPEDLPKWIENDLEMTLVAGKGYGKQSPVPVYSELFMVEMKSKKKTPFKVDNNLSGEIGICIVDGYIDACGERIDKGNLLVSKLEDICDVVIGENTHILLFGGEPFPEERFIFWNFVSTDKGKIEQAKDKWAKKEFKGVDGDSSYISLPKF